MKRYRVTAVAAIVALIAWHQAGAAQTSGEKESFTAIAQVNNNVATGAGTVLIDVTRWTSGAERRMLVNTLLNKGPAALLDQLKGERPTGTIRTPDSLAYDLRYAHQAPLEDGGRRIVLATDRPIGFWETFAQPRSIDYPFTVIELQMGRDGTGRGTLSYATRITAHDDTIELENFGTSPVMLTEVHANKSE